MRILLKERSPLPTPGPVLAALLLLLCGQAPALTITEVFYHPGRLEEDGPSLEYLELFNDSSIVVELSGAYFTEGIRFTFPEDTYLAAGSYLAVCARAAVVGERLQASGVIGDFEGQLDNGGERIRLVTRSGAPLAEVRYGDRGDWPAAADGTGFSLCLIRPFADPRRASNWTWSALPGGTPGAENFPPPFDEDRVLIPETGPEAIWRYRKGYDAASGRAVPFSDPPEAWREIDFDDSAWEEGETPIGYNEPEIATPLEDMAGRYLAFAARRKVFLDPSRLEEADHLVLSLRFDDGCVVYLNGREIGRVNLDGEPGETVPPDAPAVRAREALSSPVEFVVPAADLRRGENIIAVQIHNVQLDSNDAVFVPSLLTRATIHPPGPPEPSVVVNELVPRDESGSGSIELYNPLTDPVDLDGCLLCPTATASSCLRLAAGTRLAPGGFLALTEEELGWELQEPTMSVVLFAPNGVDVIDAVTVENPSGPASGPRSSARWPDGSPRWWISTRPSPGTPNAIEVERGIVINEIHYRPKILDGYGRPLNGKAHGDWLELYNRSDHTVSLEGTRLTQGVHYAFGPGTSLPPGGYLVVARDPEYVRSTYGLPPARVTGPSATATEEQLAAFGVLDNGGETIRLEDALGNPLDEVHYRDGGTWDPLADGGGSSLELIDPRGENTAALAWVSSDESHKAPWTEISFEAPYSTDLVPAPMESELHIYMLSAGECLIDEVSITAGDPPLEYVPNGGFETDTRPWRLWGTHVRSQRTTVEAGAGEACLHVIATGAGDNRVNRIEVDTSRVLESGPVRVKLRARWLRGSNALHISGHNNAFGKTIWLPVPRDTGSPGRENGVREAMRRDTGSDNPGPIISDVRHEPAVPRSGEPVRVLAALSDPDGVQAARVLYRRDGESGFTAVPLGDEGSQGDDSAGDGVYTGRIPGHPTGTIVSFLVEATDSPGQVSTYPRKPEEHLPVFLVDEPLESPLASYRLVVNAQNLRAPGTGLETRLLHSDEPVRGTFIFDESDVYYDVGLRYHGSPWNRPSHPRMFRVRFPDDHPFHGHVKRINLSRYGFQQNEGTAYHLVEKASVPWARTPYSPRYQYLTLKLNERAHGTVMAEIRPVDDEYVEFHWPADDEGYAWKLSGKLAFSDSGSRQGDPDWTRLETHTQGPYPGTHSPENHRFYYNPTLRKDEDVFEPLIDLLKVMDRRVTPDSEYDTRIREVLHVESALRVFAVRSLLADWDTVDLGNGQNAYLYYAPREGRHYYLPWDMDHTFERTDFPLVPPPASHGFGRLLERPVFRRLYAGLIEEQLETSWSDSHIRLWTRLVEETATPGLVRPGDHIVEFLRVRRAQASAFIQSGIRAEFEVLGLEPVGASTGAVQVRGSAPLRVARIFARVNDAAPRLLEPVWSPPSGQPGLLATAWEATVDGLRQGANTVQLLAYERAGEFYGSRTVRYSTGTSADFIRGEVDGSGRLDTADAITVLVFLFRSGDIRCLDAADVNDDGRVNVSDPITLILHLFGGYGPLPAPQGETGPDPTPDGLDCEE